MIVREQSVHRNELHTLGDCLRDEKAIKRVAVQIRQGSYGGGVLWSDVQHLMAGFIEVLQRGVRVEWHRIAAR